MSEQGAGGSNDCCINKLVSGQCSLAFAYVVQYIVVLHHFINPLNDIQYSFDSFLVAPLEEDIVLETTALDFTV